VASDDSQSKLPRWVIVGFMDASFQKAKLDFGIYLIIA
jgi:hypothetical protein